MIILLFIGIGLILYGFWKWATINNNYFISKGVKYMKPTFLLGNAGKFFLNRITLDKLLYEMYNSFPNEKIIGAFEFRSPIYFIRDPELVKNFTIKEFDHFEDHRTFIDDKADDMFGNSLPMLCGNKWRDMRATLSPAFTGSKMRQMFELVHDCAVNMSEHFKQKTIQTGEIIQPEMKELFSRYTNDVIASAAFGIKVDSYANENNEFFCNGKQMMNFTRPKIIGKLILSRVCPKLMEIFGLQVFDYDVRKFFKTMVMDTISIRNREQIFRPDLINLLKNVKNGNFKKDSVSDCPNYATATTTTTNTDVDGYATVEESIIGKTHQVKREWNDNELVAQCFVFFLGGFDTNSTVLAFTTYLLAVNQDCQEKLYHEILTTNRKLTNQLTYDDLQKMKYLDQVVSEVLRMWPPAMFSDRLCVKDYEYNDGNSKFIIEKGMCIWIPIYSFHNDPIFFPNPTKFDPERFSDENKHKIQSGTYIPFGSGPRNCIGSRFALMVVKALIYNLMLNFKFEPNEKTQIPIRLKPHPAGAVTEKGFHLNLVLRT